MRINQFRLLNGILIAAALAACSQAVTPAPSTPTPVEATVPAATPTGEPYILLMAPETPPTKAANLAIQAVEGYASENGLDLRRVTPGDPILASGPLGNPALVAAVASGGGPALAAAAQARPEVRFIAIEEPGVQPLPNLLVLGGENVRHDQAAFMAGLIATIENRNDYVGWIGEADTTRGKIFQNGFRHGVRYNCPRCRVFDLELPASADSAGGASAAAQLMQNFIDTASAIPGTAGEAALLHFSKNGIRVAGAGPDLYLNVFGGGSAAGAANVLGEPDFRPDLLLADLLPRYLAGESFQDPIPYSMENGGLDFAPFPNAWISSARQAFLQNILDEVAAGRLDIGIDPATGEER
jgi:basic membrane lipoprotein Med (substrate-binding protein (PBP1-ABC) superfamily)